MRRNSRFQNLNCHDLNETYIFSEMMLMDNECPQDLVKTLQHTMLVYKRIDAKIAWPKQDKDNF